jgi:co-chaperonin GroES (HSP10)
MIKVTGCRILVKPFKIQEHDKVFDSAKKAGIILTEVSERKEQVNIDKGIVLQMGSKCHEDYVNELAIGDTIAYAKFGGKFITEPGKEEEIFLVINDEDVVAIFKEDL